MKRAIYKFQWACSYLRAFELLLGDPFLEECLLALWNDELGKRERLYCVELAFVELRAEV